MTGDPRIDWYDTASGPEAMLRFGPDDGPVVIAALPLFEEANRTRTFMLSILRALAGRGIGSVLPDIPGQGESPIPLETVSLLDMRTAFGAASVRACAGKRRGYAVAIRSGALLDGDVPLAGRWHLSPQDGTALRRDLSRMRQAGGGGGSSAAMSWREDDMPVEIAGNLIGIAFLGGLDDAPPPVADRTVRLASDIAAADLKIDAAPLWRRSEPGNDPAIAQHLADGIADWIATCEG